MNKYLEKIASYEDYVDPVRRHTLRDYEEDLLEDDENEINWDRETVRDQNRWLIDKGYRPTIHETKSGAREAHKLSNMDWEATGAAPNMPRGRIMATAVGTGTLGVIAGGLLSKNPLLAAVGGFGGLAGGAVLGNKLFYKEHLRAADEKHRDTHANLLHEHLKNKYQAL